MIEEGKFGLREAIAISALAIITKVFYTNPGATIKSAGTAGWWVTFISALVSLILFFLLVYTLLKRFPGQNLVEIFQEVFGKVLGKVVSLFFISYFIFVAGSNIREFVEMIKAYNLPYTPPSVIIFTFLLPVAYITNLGLESLVRLAYLSFWMVLGGIIAILIFAYPLYIVDALFPLTGYGLEKDLIVAVSRHSAYNEVIILAFMVHSLQGLRNLKLASLTSLLITGIMMSLVILCATMAFDYTMGKEHISNLFELSRAIQFGRFFQRTESLFLIIWVIASVVYVTTFFYLGISIFCRTFNINNHRPLILPFIFLTAMITLLPENLSETIDKGTKFQRVYSSSIVYLLPCLALFFSIILRKKGPKTKQ